MNVISDRIGISIGDPSGIGAEITAAAIARSPRAVRRRLRIFCDRWVLERGFGEAGVEADCLGEVAVDDLGATVPNSIEPGRSDAASGAAQVAYLEAAIAAAARGEISALVTAPIHKPSARLAGMEGIGHTELLAARLATGPVAMMFAGPRFRAALATVHIPLAEVAAALTVERIVDVCRLSVDALIRDFAIEAPRIGVLGLNPHAGDGGLIGSEEQRIIEPAIAACRAELGDRAEIIGPLVPDVAYRRRLDLWLAMYHDQALIPLKLDDFDATVNVTLGLPIVRTSPDHGVAHDIAGRGLARPDSFIRALELAVEMAARRFNGSP